jgi:hypothetical protein
MKYKSLINLLYLWLHTEIKSKIYGEFYFFLPLAIEILQNNFNLEFLISNLHFWQNFTSKRKDD